MTGSVDTMQYNTIQYNKIQYSTIQYTTLDYIALHCMHAYIYCVAPVVNSMADMPIVLLPAIVVGVTTKRNKYQYTLLTIKAHMYVYVSYNMQIDIATHTFTKCVGYNP